MVEEHASRDDTARERGLAGRRLGALSDVLQVGFVLLDADHAVDDATPTACALLGAEDVGELRRRWPTIVKRLTPGLQEAHLGSGPPAADIDLDVGGEPHRVWCEIHRLDEEDCVGHLVLVQAHERVAALDAALRLASRHRTLSSLFTATAHDFKGSLNAMSLNVELLDRVLQRGDGERARETTDRCVSVLRQELKRLERTVGRALDESREQASAPSRFDVADIIESALDVLRVKADRQRVALVFDRPAGLVEVMGHAEWIQQAVLNLAHNALEAMPEGGRLVVNLAGDGDWAGLSVEDTGAGISDTLQQRIWELYFSTKSQGHGIGLHVVKRVVQAHGGTVTLDTGARGSRFTIRLPRLR